MSRRLGRLWLLLALAGAALLAGCSSGQPTPEWPAPQRRPAASYVPADLDVVLRLDLARIRDSLPDAAWGALLGWADLQDGDDGSALVTMALARAERVWIGVRPSLRGAALDTVFVLEGDFSRIPPEPRLRAFLPGQDRGAGLVVFDAKRAPRRSSPGRIYSWNEELWIVASPAEIDAVERTVELGVRAESGLSPPERGVVSMAIRASSFVEGLRVDAPRAASLLEGAELVEASCDLKADGVRLRLEVTFTHVEGATRAGRALDVLRLVLERDGEGWGLGELTTEVVASTLVIEASSSLERLGRLLE